MAHDIDMSNGRANVAYIGETPWHGLGFQLEAGASVADWQRAAGLEWTAERATVQYMNGSMHTFKGRDVLYRSDTAAPLSVVSSGYRIVQPAEVMEFFRQLTELNGFTMETAGALSGGKRIWGLAKMGAGIDIAPGDRVMPYVLLATSYDGTLATVAKATAVRVVCANTIAAALPRGGRGDQGEGAVRINHSGKFDASDTRMRLGHFADDFERFAFDAKRMAAMPLDDAQADSFLVQTLAPYEPNAEIDAEEVRETRGYKAIRQLYESTAIGRQLAGPTRWGLLNAVTEYVDHHRGRSDNTRLEAAWFGAGNALKNRARELLAA